MAYHFKSGKLTNFFDPVSRVHIQPHKPVKVEIVPNSSYFRNALRTQAILKCTEEEYCNILGIEIGEEPTPTTKQPRKARTHVLSDMTRKEILKEYAWMDTSDLAEAEKKNKKEMITYLLKIEQEYED